MIFFGLFFLFSFGLFVLSLFLLQTLPAERRNMRNDVFIYLMRKKLTNVYLFFSYLFACCDG